jgi:hypothetical protein
MGYYHIKLDADAQKLCTVVFPWNMRKYKYKCLPMEIKISWLLMFFKMSFLNLLKIRNMLRQPFYLDDLLKLTLRLTCYLDDLLILTNSSFKDHLLRLEMVLARFSTSEMRLNHSILMICEY